MVEGWEWKDICVYLALGAYMAFNRLMIDGTARSRV